jgi:hypothetical protein
MGCGMTGWSEMIEYLNSDRISFDSAMLIAMIAVFAAFCELYISERYFFSAFMSLVFVSLAFDWRKWRRKI